MSFKGEPVEKNEHVEIAEPDKFSLLTPNMRWFGNARLKPRGCSPRHDQTLKKNGALSPRVTGLSAPVKSRQRLAQTWCNHPRRSRKQWTTLI